MKRHIDGDGFQIELETQRNYLRAYVHGGEDSVEVSMGYWRLVGEVCREFATRRLLVVEDLVPWHASESDFERVIDLTRRVGLDQVQVAYTSLQAPLDLNEMGVIVGMEKGMWMRLFASERDAVLWLGLGTRPDTVT